MYDAPQYKFLLIPDYQPDKSALILKVHHNMCDGLGLATLFQSFNDVYESSTLPRMKEISFCKEFMVLCISPFLMLWVFFKVQLMGADNNSIHNDEKLSGSKALGRVENMNVSRMKDFCRSKKVTINDYCATLFSMTMHEYLQNEEAKAIQNGSKVYKTPETVRIAIPFSFRQPYKNLSDI
jgi:NRPS condensation-like uncharacterized protein